MKSPVYTILLALMLVFSACDKENLPAPGPDQPQQLAELKLEASSASVTLDERSADQEAICLQWTAGVDFGTGKPISYTLELDLEDHDFSAPVTVLEATKSLYTWQPTVEELNSLVTEDLEIIAGESARIAARVTAKVEGQTMEQTATVAFTVQTYRPVTDKLYIIGSATKTGWSAEQADFMTRTDNGHFTWRGYLRPGEFKFLLQLGQYLPSYNKGKDGKLLYRKKDHEPDVKFTINEAGAYGIELDLFTMEIKVSRLEEDIPPFDQLFFVGSMTQWIGVPMQRDLTDPYIFRLGIHIDKPGDFKFATMPGSWENMYKAVTENASYKETRTTFVKEEQPDFKWYLQDYEVCRDFKIGFDTRPGQERMLMSYYYLTCGACVEGSAVPAGQRVLFWTNYKGELVWTGELQTGSLRLICDDSSHDCKAMPGVDGKVPTGSVEQCILFENTWQEKDLHKYVDESQWNNSWYIPEAGTYKIVLDKLRETIMIMKTGKDLPELVEGESINLSTDKARYNPGESVVFHADRMPAGAMIRYRRDGATVHEETAGPLTWTWNPPTQDFRGYMVEVYRPEEGGKETIFGTIAVDVSSDWTRYPRYGFVADFGADKLQPGVIKEEMEYLNRCHINGVQFYDWHNKHHWPLGGTRKHPDEVYKDIANRDVYTETIRKYIEVQHRYGMKAMFYNLCNGALEDAAADGVPQSWGLYKNSNGTDQDRHELPSSWKSDIYLLDPGHPGWHNYLSRKNDDVYANFDFDGFHIDQLGDRGTRYAADGSSVRLPDSYARFINAMKSAHPGKRLVMNAVGGYGSEQIAGTRNVDFLYNEVWDNQKTFYDLYWLIIDNYRYSDYGKNTVLAAYMNYECSHREFNEPGILLTDAVMFAIGGAHLELGDHMLCREYFPNQDVRMSASLKEKIIHYYDFLTAYQYLLRGVSSRTFVNSRILTDEGFGINDGLQQKGLIASVAKKCDGKKIVHLLNFRDVDQLSWRDVRGTMPEPAEVQNLKVNVAYDSTAHRVWIASPDHFGGAMQQLEFEQRDDRLYFTIPSLKYWDMIVIE